MLAMMLIPGNDVAPAIPVDEVPCYRALGALRTRCSRGKTRAVCCSYALFFAYTLTSIVPHATGH